MLLVHKVYMLSFLQITILLLRLHYTTQQTCLLVLVQSLRLNSGEVVSGISLFSMNIALRRCLGNPYAAALATRTFVNETRKD